MIEDEKPRVETFVERVLAKADVTKVMLLAMNRA